MVNYEDLSEQAQLQVQAIVSGRGLGTKSGYAEALEFVNENAALRNASVGGAPAGLNQERLQTFKEQFGIRPNEQIEATSRISPNVTLPPNPIENMSRRIPLNQSVAPTATEMALSRSLPEGIRDQPTLNVARSQTPREIKFSDINFLQSVKTFPTNIVGKDRVRLDPISGETFFLMPDNSRVPFDPSKSISSYINQKFVKLSKTPYLASSTAKVISDIFSPLGLELSEGEIESALKSPTNFNFADQLKFLFFSPALSTGKAGVKTKQVVVEESSGGSSSASGKKAEQILKAFEKAFAEKGQKGINDRLTLLKKTIQAEPNQQLREIANNNFKQFLELLRQRGLIKGFVFDEATGNFQVANLEQQVLGKANNILTGNVVKESANIPQASVLSSGTQTGSSLFFQQPSKFAGQGLYETSNFVAPSLKTQSKGLLTPLLKSEVAILSSSSPKNKSNLISPLLSSTPLSVQQNKPSQQFNPLQNNSPLQNSNQLNQQRTEQRTNQSLFFSTAQSTQQRTQQRQQQRQRTQQRTPGKLNLFGSEEPQTKKKVIPKNQGLGTGYSPQIKVGGVWKTITNKSYTQSQAQRLMAFTIDRSLAASGRLVKTNKVPVKSNFGVVDLGKFRNYSLRKGKRKPLANFGLIEEPKHRLDYPSEVKSLQAFKRSKQFNSFLNRAPESTTRKRKKTSSLFFR